MKKWKCAVCGYIHTGENPPEKCPVCGAKSDKFKEIADKETKSLKEYIDAQIQGEAWEIVHYLGAAMLAEKLGYPEVGLILRRIASDEMEHGANYVFRSGETVGNRKESLRDFIKKMIEAEKGAHRMKTEGFSLALSVGNTEMASLFKTSAEDEARHAEMWKKALDMLG